MKVGAWMEGLSPRARWILVASAINQFGSGLALPLLIPYVTQGLDLDLQVATAALAITSLAAGVSGPAFGWLADKGGRSIAVYAALSASFVGTTVYGLAQGPTEILAGAVALGLGIGGNAAWFTVLAESVPEERRARVFGTNFLVVNVVLGVSGIVAGLAVLSAQTVSFRLLHAADALTFVVAGIVFARVFRRTRSAAPAGPDGAEPRPVARSPLGLGVWICLIIVALGYFAGYSQLESGVPALMLAGGAAAAQLSIVYATNSIGVIVGQVLLMARIERASERARLTALILLWIASWVLIGLAALLLEGWALVALVSVGAFVFALGECVYSMTIPVILNGLADDASRGRVNGLNSVATSAGFFAGPLFAGAVLSDGNVGWYVAAMIAGCGLIGVATSVLARSRPAGARVADGAHAAAPSREEVA